MNDKPKGMRNEELGNRNSQPPPRDRIDVPGGWAAFLIPNSYFLIDAPRSGCSR